MENLEIFRGELLTFTTPSLNQVTIREQNAEDDDILGRISRGDITGAMNEFVAAIVVESTYETSQKDGALSLKDVLDLPLRDKTYILFKSRLHSMGPRMVFTHTFKDGKEVEFEEDLNIFDQDLSLTDSTSVPEGKDKNCITRYPGISDSKDYLKPFEINLTSGRTVRMKRMTGRSEEEALQANKNKAMTVNTEYFIRGLEIFHDQTWKRVSSMNLFSKKDVIEMKNAVSKIDTQFLPMTRLYDPVSDQEEYLPVVAIQDFFFPTEI